MPEQEQIKKEQNKHQAPGIWGKRKNAFPRKNIKMQIIPELSTGLPEGRNRNVLKYLQVVYKQYIQQLLPSPISNFNTGRNKSAPSDLPATD